ncbi:MAG: TolC family protein [Planctomycetes bacterium]|nr:TolC family protein [Planctomycetota bacterium]
MLLVLGGCMQHYQPPLLPVFMREGDDSVAESREQSAPQPRFLPESQASKMRDEPAILTVAAEEPLTLRSQGTSKDHPDSTSDELLPAPRSLQTGLSLNDAIEATVQADPRVHSAWETIQQARADFATSSLVPNPQFFMDSQLNPLGQQWTPTQQGGPPQMDWYFNWPIDWYLSGRRVAQMNSARLGVDMSAADFANLVRQRVAASIAAYFDVLEAKAFVDLEQQNLDNLKEVEDITRKRVKLGGAGPIELDRVRLAVLESQRELRRRQTVQVTAAANLLALMGQRLPAVELRILGDLKVPNPAEPLETSDALRLAEESRPDLASLRVQVEKAEADVQVEQTKSCPTVNPAFGFTHQFQRQVLNFPDARSWNVALTMSLPVLDRNQGNILKARSKKSQALFNLQAQILTIQAEIEQALQEFRMAHLNVTQNDAEFLETARRVRERLTAAYQLGGRSYLEVLDAQRAYRETYRLFIISQSNYWQSLNRLNAAIGKQVLR